MPPARNFTYSLDEKVRAQGGLPAHLRRKREIEDELARLLAHIARLRELAEIGADQFAVYLMHDDEENTLEAYGNEIIPALR